MIWALLENFVFDMSYVSDSENENDDSSSPFEDNPLQTHLLKSYVADNIVGFLDKRNSDSSKRILNIPILNSKKKVSVVLRSANAQVLILSDNTLSNIEKLKIDEDCLESNIKVYNSGAISDWENQ
jgi:FlaA1/EpsC-like NDP-sugar epimerase